MNIKIVVLWDVTKHGSVDRYQRFGEIFCAHLLEELHNITSQMSVTLISSENDTQMW
jgi:hypothetical protein